jgi:hypothetical protein
MNPTYGQLWSLFEDSLRRQAPGTCSDIMNGRRDSLMAVPFLTWYDKCRKVVDVLSKNKDLMFTRDLIKNHIEQSICIFSGDRLEITPRLIPIDLIPSFSDARSRVFLSATLSEDALLVRDMGIAPESVTDRLCVGDVTYSGERLILLPSLVDTARAS